MISTFETLSNEILITILQYCGDSYTIFQTFIGLNQRLNSILINKYLHLFTNFLYINPYETTFSDYYNKSNIFQTISYELLHINTKINEEKLRQYFQSLVTFHINEQFKQLKNSIQINLTTFKLIRQQLTDIEIVNIDNQIRNKFFNLKENILTINSIKQIESLILTKGACLKCSDHYMNNFNLAQSLNHFLFCHLNNLHSPKQLLIQPLTQMFKIIIISNPNLLKNQDRTEYDDSNSVWFFLFYSIYQLQYWYYTPPDIYINMKCYNAVLHLLLCAIQCYKQINTDENWLQKTLFDILNMVPSYEKSNKNQLYIQYIQWEILKLIINEYILTEKLSWEEDQDDLFRLILNNLIKNNRLDVIRLIYYQLKPVENYFNKIKNIEKNVNIMTGSLIGRKLFKELLNEKPLKSWLTNKNLIFLLLKKKERQLIEKLFKFLPFLINEIDENGNDPLLYICLKVHGCRHRIIQFLITIGCNLQRKNFNNEDFFHVIQLKRNEKLFKKLLENQIIKINNDSKQIQVILPI